MPDTLSIWIRRMDYDDWSWLSNSELLGDHQELHRDFGEKPNEEIIPIEQRIAYEMRRRGFEHRHVDALAKAASTIVENPIAPSAIEAQAYLSRDIVLHHGSLKIAEDVEQAGLLYLLIEGAGLTGLESAVLRMLNRWLPPGFDLKLLDSTVRDGFVSTRAIHDLVLREAWSPPMTTTWESITFNFRTLAAKAAPAIFDAEKPVSIPFRVAKSAQHVPTGIEWNPDSAYVLGPVLIPGKLDKTTTDPGGTPTGAVGDMASVRAVRGAFEFWTIAKRSFEYQHAVQGGRIYDEDEITPLDNWTSPANMIIEKDDGTHEEFPMGTWFLGSRINEPEAARQALAGELTSWSIYANCLGRYEQLQEEATSSS